MKLTLPSGAVVVLQTKDSARGKDLETLLERGVVAIDVDIDALPLGDVHVLRGVLMKEGVLEEDEVDITCRNCDASISLRPCAGLEIAPWLDGEADDEELDRTLPFGEPHAIPPVKLGKVRTARTVTLAPLSWSAAKGLLGELDPSRLGVVALGRERDAARIAEAMEDGDTLAAIAPVWLASHYVLRLSSSVTCKACKARNEIDAPYDRELDPGEAEPVEASEGFPSFDEFDAVVRALAAPTYPADVELVTDEGVPATDAGGDTEWGHYETPVLDDPLRPAHPARVTLFYRTFQAVWNEEGPYDWQDEVAETLEHELDHHIAFLRGDDPMADEEDAAIGDEAARVVGRRETERRAWAEMRGSVPDFFRRTWILWLVLFAAFALVYASSLRD